MEENDLNTGNSNWNPRSNQIQTSVPYGLASLILGILSLVCTVLFICCYGWIPGLVTGVIGLILGIMATKTYKENPAIYTESSFRTAKVGKILCIVSLSLCALLIIVGVIAIATGVALDSHNFYKRMR